jgi:hypothetical protein
MKNSKNSLKIEMIKRKGVETFGVTFSSHSQSINAYFQRLRGCEQILRSSIGNE